MRCLFILCFIWGVALQLEAQQAKFTATVDAARVVPRTMFNVHYTLENANGTQFTPPSFKGADFVSGPSTSRSTSIYNGVMTQSMSYTYSLMFNKPGKYAIGPASIKVGNQVMKSNAVSIEVVEGKVGTSTSTSPSAQDVRLRAELSSKTAYPGQQVRLDYKIYTTVNVRNYNTLREDDYDQFYFRYLQDFNHRAQLEVLDGIQYTTQTVKSVALFPQQAGTFGIDPMMATFGVTVKEERPSFFFGARTVPVTTASDSLSLKVLPLPDGAPDSFTGAVGTYKMSAQVNKQRLSTDDALMLTLEIIGNGDPKRWSPPDLSSLGGEYELYEPRVVTDDVEDAINEVRHRRVIEYVMLPLAAGDRTLQVSFSYFDPADATYKTINSTPFELKVTQGSNIPGEMPAVSMIEATKSLRGLKPMSHGSNITLLFTPVYFGLVLLPLGFLGFFWYKKRNADLFESLDPVEKKRRRARKLAAHHLHEAKQRMDREDERAFYDSLSRALFSYLSAKLKIPASQLTKANIAAHLDKIALSAELKEEALTILSTNEQVLYAGSNAGVDRSSMYDRVHGFIEHVEQAVGSS